MTDKCETKHAHHSEAIKKDMRDRLSKIEGQVRGLKKMIDNDIYCDDILIQIAAVQSGLKKVGRILLRAHMKSCIVEQVRENKIEVIDELMTTIDKLMR